MGADFVFNILNILMICGIAIVTSSFSQFISWFLLYRKEDYRLNKNEIQKLNKKLQKLKNTHVIEAQNKNHKKKVSQTQGQIKSLNQQMTFQSMKSNIIIGFVMIGVINMIGTYFQGIVMVNLPFEPFAFFKGIFHRNIQGEDYTQAAYLPIYIMTAFIWRANLKKILGFEAPKAAVTFFDPPKFKE